MLQDGVSLHIDIYPYHELLAALLFAGYEITSAFSPIDVERLSGQKFTYTLSDRFYNSDLPELLNLTTPFNFSTRIPNVEQRTSLLPPEAESLPRFSWRTCMVSHVSNLYRHIDADEVTELSQPEIMRRYYLYPLPYAGTTVEMLTAIDEILETDPNAVIILQGDHGFHISEPHAQLLEDGYSTEQVLELTYSVFSAVRIPQEYGGLNEPIAPLDITRELVNRFVGENY